MCHLKFIHLIHMFQSSHYCGAMESQKCGQSTNFIRWKKSEKNLANEVRTAVAVNSAVLWNVTLIVMFMYSYCLYVLFCIFCFHRAN